jgi:hypothetical protein
VKFPTPEGFAQWIRRDAAFFTSDELAKYPRIYRMLFSIIKSGYWDQMYLNLLLIYLLLILYFYGGFVEQYKSVIDISEQVILVPPIFMFLCQFFPFFGMIFFIIRCNDLTKLKAQTEISHWVYIHYFHVICYTCIFIHLFPQLYIVYCKFSRLQQYLLRKA